MSKLVKWRGLGALLCFAAFSGGCGEGGDGDGGGRGNSNGGSGGGGAVGSDCVESPVFPLRPFGDTGQDIVRGIQVDEATGDIFFITLDDLFVVRAGATEPERLGERPAGGVEGTFWLTEDAILFGGFPRVMREPSVLYATDRDGTNLREVIPLPSAPSINWYYESKLMRIVGDDAIWIGVERYTDQPGQLLPEFEYKYSILRTSWRSPGEPEELYATPRYIEDLVIASGKAIIDEEIGEEKSFDFEQKVIDLETGDLDPTPPLERFGGTVVGGDDDELVVSRLDWDNLETMGTYRVPTSGGEGERISENFLARDFDYRDDAWAFTDAPGAGEPTGVKVDLPTAPARTIGCIAEPATTHALWVGPDDVLVGFARDDESSILRFPR